MTAQAIEIFGYLASIFVAISLLMVSLLRLRILNLAGCGFFIIYGALIGSLPIVITNSFITLVNIYYIVQMYRKDISSFTYEDIGGRLSALIDFVKVKQSDILKFYPDFNLCQLRAASSGNGLIYVARKGGRHQGFAFALKGLGLDLDEYCDADLPLKEALATIRLSQYSQEPVFLADYIVGKYRDLGLADAFHNKLLQDLKGTCKALLWVNHCGNKRMHRLLINVGYEEFDRKGDYEVLLLKLS